MQNNITLKKKQRKKNYIKDTQHEVRYIKNSNKKVIKKFTSPFWKLKGN